MPLGLINDTGYVNCLKLSKQKIEATCYILLNMNQNIKQNNCFTIQTSILAHNFK